MIIKVAARTSHLSRAQVQEVSQLLGKFYHIHLEPIYTQAYGDKDLKTSLTELSKSDFFTKDIDDLVLSQKADIAIHSAKDLPDTLDPRLELIALTQGIDPRDSLVSFKYALKTLPKNAIIGACSKRRIEAIRELKSDAIIKDIRGPIDLRIDLLKNGQYDAIILAEAGLLRLKLDVPREILQIPTAPLQGRLAIVALKQRDDLKNLFAPLDAGLCGSIQV